MSYCTSNPHNELVLEHCTESARLWSPSSAPSICQMNSLTNMVGWVCWVYRVTFATYSLLNP